MQTSQSTVILAVETSCDETAVSVVRKTGEKVSVLSSVISSQIALHAPFGGVVPDLAAREHAKNILPVLKEALAEAKISRDDITALAVTNGPGLIPALIIGTVAAKTLAYAWKKPLLGIHHIEGHIYANFIQPTGKNSFIPPCFPLLALVVSGGHTQLVLMSDHFTYEILGETKDDAAGEAFDKVAKMLGLPYPGGPVVAELADTFSQRCRTKPHPPSKQTDSRSFEIPNQVRDDNAGNFHFPRPMLHSGDFDFSFSGLKTAVLYTVKKHPEKIGDTSFQNEICHEFQEAVIDVLAAKTKTALERYQPKSFVIAGGVSANTALRSRLQNMLDSYFPNTRFLTPEFAYSLDNAAMIASAASFRWDALSREQQETAKNDWQNLSADAGLTLTNLSCTNR